MPDPDRAARPPTGAVAYTGAQQTCSTRPKASTMTAAPTNSVPRGQRTPARAWRPATSVHGALNCSGMADGLLPAGGPVPVAESPRPVRGQGEGWGVHVRSSRSDGRTHPVGDDEGAERWWQPHRPAPEAGARAGAHGLTAAVLKAQLRRGVEGKGPGHRMSLFRTRLIDRLVPPGAIPAAVGTRGRTSL